MRKSEQIGEESRDRATGALVPSKGYGWGFAVQLIADLAMVFSSP